jgi:uroporphyrinogen decarboxylase
MAILDPDYQRLLTTLRGGQADRVPILELIVDREIKSAFLARRPANVADDIEFWYRAGYDCATVYPESPAMWFYQKKGPGAVSGDPYSESGFRTWASEGKGLIQDWADLEKYPLCSIDEINFSYFDEARRLLPSGMALIGAWGDIFTYTWEAMGFEQFSFALFEREALVSHVFQSLGKLAIQIIEALLSYDIVKALWYSDDLAHKTGLLVSRDVYRKYLFPWLKQMGDMCHKAGRPFLFHSDGVLWSVIDDLADCGICALQPIEPQAMDIRELKRRYSHKFCLIGNVDVDLLCRGTHEAIRRAVRALLKGVAPGGGYCLGSGNTVADYVPIENYRVMVDEALLYGKYPIELY